MSKLRYTEILRNEHFCQWAALLSMGMSRQWRMAHPEVPNVSYTIEKRLLLLNRSSPALTLELVKEWTTLLHAIIEADRSLFYTVKDMDWFVHTLEGVDAQVTFAMLFAVASTPRRWFSADEVATFPDRQGKTVGASTWRARALEGRIIGAVRVGKGEKARWLLPDLSLIAMGIQVPAPEELDEGEQERRTQEIETPEREHDAE